MKTVKETLFSISVKDWANNELSNATLHGYSLFCYFSSPLVRSAVCLIVLFVCVLYVRNNIE